MDIEDLSKKIYNTDYLVLREFMDDELKSKMEEYIFKLVDNFNNDKIKHKHDFTRCIKTIEKELSFPRKMKQSEINYFLRKMYCEDKLSIEEFEGLKGYLLTKKMQSQSGILEVAIMTSPGEFSCAYNCYYCPDQQDMPRSYVKEEPAVKRAAMNNFDTVKQFYDRATTYSLNGHNVDKIELIVLGGTWSSYPYSYQRTFIRDLYYAANTFYLSNDRKQRERLTLLEEQKINENALCHIIGLTLETRPDSINIQEIKRFNLFGVTRVQLGIQHTDNNILRKINRQSTIEDAIKAIWMLKECGFKIMIHIMPNLPFSNPEKDIEMFDKIINSEYLQADEWKIYPTSVTTTSDKDDEEVNSVIEKWYKDGKYEPYSNEELFDVILHAKMKIPKWIRIARIFRDIPKPNIIGGADIPNMRQILAQRMKEMGEHCACIRCNEVKDRKIDSNNYVYKINKYQSSLGKEIFISVESFVNNKRAIHAFARLRISSDSGLNNEYESNGITALKGCSLLRELHVYGQVQTTFDSKNKSNNQHKGLGSKLIEYCEKLTLKHGFYKMAIISGVGVRNYYRKKGYKLEGYYMIKEFNPLWNNIKWFIHVILFILLTTLYYYIINYLIQNLLNITTLTRHTI